VTEPYVVEVVENLEHLAGRRHYQTDRDGSLTYELANALPPDAAQPFPVLTRDVGSKDYNTSVVYVGPSSLVAPILGYDLTRKKATISNTSANTSIQVGKRSQVTSGNGFPVPPNTNFSIDAQSEVFAGPMPGYAGAAIMVGVFAETE